MGALQLQQFLDLLEFSDHLCASLRGVGEGLFTPGRRGRRRLQEAENAIPQDVHPEE